MIELPLISQRIADVTRYWAEHTPQAPALHERGAVVSYGELMRRIEAAANLLRARGVTCGDRVMIVGENCSDEIMLFFAAIELSAWPVIVNARMSEREVDVIRTHCEPRVQLYTSVVSADAAAHARRADAIALSQQLFPGIDVTPTDGSARAEPLERAREVAMLLYTSGTTGAPKGVMLTHRGLLHFCRVSASSRALGPADRIYAVLPFAHIFGIATIVLSTLFAGASLWIETRFDPARAIDTLETHGVTTLQGVPMMWRRLLAHLRGLSATPRFPNLRYLYVGGGGLEPVLKADIERTFGLPVHHGYGMTEYAGSMFITPTDRPRRDCSSGLLNPGCEARIVDEMGRDVVAGQPGEIWVRGTGTMLGYYRAPELTREVLLTDGWMRTGDVGRMDVDGALFVVGRRKELIKRSGFNVFPIEVEAVLNSHPKVRLSAVLGQPLHDGDEEVVALIEVESKAAIEGDELHSFLAERLVAYKRPTRIICIDALPMNANGKVRKHELKTLLSAAAQPVAAEAI